MSDPRSETVTVRIYDREYTLRTSDNASNLLELCRELDRRMRECAQASGSVDTLKVAILTALGLTDELERAREALSSPFPWFHRWRGLLRTDGDWRWRAPT
jgi:cell division protein ZapA